MEPRPGHLVRHLIGRHNAQVVALRHVVRIRHAHRECLPGQDIFHRLMAGAQIHGHPFHVGNSAPSGVHYVRGAVFAVGGEHQDRLRVQEGFGSKIFPRDCCPPFPFYNVVLSIARPPRQAQSPAPNRTRCHGKAPDTECPALEANLQFTCPAAWRSLRRSSAPGLPGRGSPIFIRLGRNESAPIQGFASGKTLVRAMRRGPPEAGAGERAGMESAGHSVSGARSQSAVYLPSCLAISPAKFRPARQAGRGSRFSFDWGEMNPPQSKVLPPAKRLYAPCGAPAGGGRRRTRRHGKRRTLSVRRSKTICGLLAQLLSDLFGEVPPHPASRAGSPDFHSIGAK